MADTYRQTLYYFSRSPGLTPPTRWCGKGSPPWGSSSLTASVSPPCPPSASAPPGRTTGRPSPARRRTRQTDSRTQPQSGEICANSAIFSKFAKWGYFNLEPDDFVSLISVKLTWFGFLSFVLGFNGRRERVHMTFADDFQTLILERSTYSGFLCLFFVQLLISSK